MRPALGQQAAGGDFHGAADLVQRYAMAGGEGLQAGDAGDHVVAEVAARASDGLDDADAAVVQRGVAPDHEGGRLAVAHLLVDQLLEHRLLVAVQLVHAGAVVGGFAFAFRLLALGEARVVAFEEALADFPAQGVELVFGRALVHQEDHIAAAQGLDRLLGDVVRVAGADADQQQFFHGLFQVGARLAGASSSIWW